MATLTIVVDPAILDAARAVAERRNTSLEAMVGTYLSSVAPRVPTAEESARFRELLASRPLGHLDAIPTRDEMHDRTWPRS